MAHAEIIRLLTYLVVFNHAQLASTKLESTSCTLRPVGGSEQRANVTCTFLEDLRQTGRTFAVYQYKLKQLVSVYPCNIISGKPVCPEIAGFEPPLTVSRTATFSVPSNTTSSFECNTIPPRKTVQAKPCTFPDNDDTESTLATASNTGTTVDRESDEPTGLLDWQITLCFFGALLVLMGAAALVALVCFVHHLRNPVLRHRFSNQRDKANLEKSELENLNEPGQELSAVLTTEGAFGGVAGQELPAVVTTEDAFGGVAGQELPAVVTTEGAFGGVAGQELSAVATTEDASGGVAGQELPAVVTTEGASGGVAGQEISAIVTTEGASSGVNTLPDWCSCGRCHQMPSECERICCGKTPCLSTTQDFETSVLDRVKAWDPKDHELLHGDVNETKRKKAYKLFTLWKHGHSVKGEKYPVYSCCVWAVRDTFPDKNGKYTGFVEGDIIAFNMNDWKHRWGSQGSQ